MDTRIDRISRGLATTSSRRQALKMLGGGLVGGALAGAGFAVAKDAGAQRPPAAGGYTLPTVPVADVGDVTLAPTQFVNNGDTIGVVGNVLNDLSEVIGTFAGPAAIQDAECDILNLVLGPLELDLLGLVIEIPDPVILNIFAEPGPGNLLGNLLCAVAGLLDGNAPTGGLTGLLNNILRALGLA